jgi:hypothetical protein
MGAESERVKSFGKLEDGLRQSGECYQWGPYVSERQWGTVREDYSAEGGAWGYLPHDHARSRPYRWGEDGMAGFCDVEQRLCLALALWNGRDPILKERMFGPTGAQANHSEDVLRHRMVSIFLGGPNGRRPCFGGADKFQHDPAWKDNLLFNEYFGENGAGLGASHQTGWTGIVADAILRSHGAVESIGGVVGDVQSRVAPR